MIVEVIADDTKIYFHIVCDEICNEFIRKGDIYYMMEEQNTLHHLDKIQPKYPIKNCLFNTNWDGHDSSKFDWTI